MKLHGVEEATRVLNDFQGLLKSERRRVMGKLAEEARVYFTAQLRNQAFDLAALTPKYLADRIRRGTGTRILVRSEGYVDSLRSGVDRDGAAVVYAQGKDPTTKRPYQEIAERLEHGTSYMRARPHWAPFGEWFKRNMLLQFGERLVREAMEMAQARNRGRK
jgi:hypothetical protein